jgi:hypothetical protein
MREGETNASSLADEGPSVLWPTVRQHLQPRGPLGHLPLPAAKGAERHNHRHWARGQAQLPCQLQARQHREWGAAAAKRVGE